MTPTFHDLGRKRTHAMATMNLRAVISGKGELEYLVRSACKPTARAVMARHQPRNAYGEFVTYALLGQLSERDLRCSVAAD